MNSINELDISNTEKIMDNDDQELSQTKPNTKLKRKNLKNDEIITDIFGESEGEDDHELEDIKNNLADEEDRLKSLSFVDRITEEKRLARIARKRREEENAMGQDEFCAKLVDKMFNAAEEDRICVSEGKLALKKLKMLDSIKISLLRTDRYESLVDHQVHSAIAEWLRILPDGALPNLRIRRILLNILDEWSRPSADIVTNSGIIRVFNSLIKHPRELASNKRIMNEIMYKWTKPVRVKCNLEDSNEDLEQEEELAKKKNKTLDRGAITVPANFDFFDQKAVIKIASTDTSLRAKMPSDTPKVFVKRPPKREIDEHMTQAVKSRMREVKQTKRFRQFVRSRENKLKYI